jgi:hypothetical protein
VSPPFIVDFGGAYLDELPEHATTAEVFEQWLQDKQEQFGKRWEEVRVALEDFTNLYKIYIVDVNPGNIRF